MQPGPGDLSCPLSKDTVKDTWIDKKPLADQGPVSLLCDYDSCYYLFSPLSNISWDVPCLVNVDSHTYQSWEWPVLKNLISWSLFPNLSNFLFSSFTPVFLVTQMSKSCCGKVSNVFFPSENLLSYDKGKEVGRGEKESWENEGRRERRKKEEKKRGKGNSILGEEQENIQILSTPCGQNLCEILSTENRGTVPARDCGWTKIFIGYKMYLLSLTTTKSIGKHLLKSCLWYNCQYIISAGGGLVSKLCPTVETPRTGTC